MRFKLNVTFYHLHLLCLTSHCDVCFGIEIVFFKPSKEKKWKRQKKKHMPIYGHIKLNWDKYSESWTDWGGKKKLKSKCSIFKYTVKKYLAITIWHNYTNKKMVHFSICFSQLKGFYDKHDRSFFSNNLRNQWLSIAFFTPLLINFISLILKSTSTAVKLSILFVFSMEYTTCTCRFPAGKREVGAATVFSLPLRETWLSGTICVQSNTAAHAYMHFLL